MSFLQEYSKELLTLLVAFITWGLNTYFKPKAKLILANLHGFVFLVQEPLKDPNGNLISPNQTVRTISFLLKNTGKETATKVELVFNWKPLCINFWPTRHFSEHSASDGRYVVIFDNLTPNEFVGFELLSVNKDLPALIIARSEQCVAQFVNIFPQQVLNPWLYRLAAALMIIGFCTVVYLTLIAIGL